MTLTELIALSKSYFGESANVVGSAFATADWTLFINKAYEEVLNDIVNLGSTFPRTTQTLSWVAGTAEYNLTTEPLRIHLVESGWESGALVSQRRKIYPMDRYYADEYWRQASSGITKPPFWYLTGTKTIGFVPTPSESKTSNVKVEYTPKITALTGSAEPSLIPSEWQELIAIKAALRSRIGNDSQIQELFALKSNIESNMRRSIRRQDQEPRYVRIKVYDAEDYPG